MSRHVTWLSPDDSHAFNFPVFFSPLAARNTDIVGFALANEACTDLYMPQRLSGLQVRLITLSFLLD